ncbi:TlpA disulfide reductase family protein [Pseudogemmatithrix spongiicola]|uniref:TlpA disulfide reductase family protein n=2 Tax=Pseudogemmatithrix spongiicola TaxID=3062599 RepID=A0AA49Q664_9BACT|nr:TlpA disulfide reductase family protein [Gemmatimonadaceae bacterium 'strain 138']WKW16271.1 TlpA disulfide reductase family protein [Gemmatimonadaceae bacterium 'strain 318']
MRVRRERAARLTMTVALGLVLSACGGAERAPAATLAIGAPAPAYAAQRMDGTPVALADHKGEAVMLNVWATWCKPCREEIPALDSLHREFGPRGFRVVGVSIDVAGDTAEIAGFARQLGASYDLWLDPDDKVSTTFRAIGVPSTALIDRDGVLRWRHMGPVRANDPALRALLDSVLN